MKTYNNKHVPPTTQQTPNGVVDTIKMHYIYFKNDTIKYLKQLRDRSTNTNTTINNDCEPYDIVNGNVVAPCGAIANSLFNGIQNPIIEFIKAQIY